MNSNSLLAYQPLSKINAKKHGNRSSASGGSSIQEEESASLLKMNRDPNKIRAREAIMRVLTCPLYMWTVMTGAIMQGAVCFILYFITQVLKVNIYQSIHLCIHTLPVIV